MFGQKYYSMLLKSKSGFKFKFDSMEMLPPTVVLDCIQYFFIKVSALVDGQNEWTTRANKTHQLTSAVDMSTKSVSVMIFNELGNSKGKVYLN